MKPGFGIIRYVMFAIKKIITSFVLPPGFMVLVLAGLGVYLWKRERRAAVFCAAVAALLWGGTTGIFSDLLLRPLENAYVQPAKPGGDAIVMLCGGFKNGGEMFSASERLAPGTLERAASAYKLYRETGLPIVISGGAPFSAGPESEAAAAWLKELGVPADRIFAEKSSRDTKENARYSVKLCGEKGYKRIVLLTSAYHMPRAVFLFGKAGAGEITPFPVSKRSGAPFFLNDWLPGNGVTEARMALNEYLGLAWYRVLLGRAKS